MSPASLAPGQRSAASGAVEDVAPGQPSGVAADPSVRIVFTGRQPAPGAGTGNLSLVVGDGDVAQARAAALALTGAEPRTAVFMQQVHGGAVAEVTAADGGRGVASYDDAIPGVDAMVTHDTDVALAVLVADCVPVILVAPGHGVGAVHAGRGGVVAGVVANAVRRLAPQGADDVIALLGPAIGGCCYEVPAGLAEEVAQIQPAARATTTWDTPSLDLPAAVEQQLREAGVGDVRRVGGCTRCNCEQLFSHRAATAGIAPAGRQAALVMRRAAAPPASPEGPASVSQRSSLESPVTP